MISNIVERSESVHLRIILNLPFGASAGPHVQAGQTERWGRSRMALT